MSEMPSIIFETNQTLFSIPSKDVQAIIKLPNVTPLPDSAENVRGLIKYRDSLYRVIDFRKVLAVKTVAEEVQEFHDMINQREKDHIHWLDELFNSVETNSKFSLTTDPHKCAFGKWYDSFESKNFMINEILKKFDAPHRKIHSIAIDIEEMKKKNNFNEAKEKIQLTKDVELQSMKNLFSDIKVQIKNERHELAILFEKGTKRFAIAVDSIKSVEKINAVETKNLDSELFELGNKNIIAGLAENNAKELIISISDDYLSI